MYPYPELSNERLAASDLAEANLSCAQGLPGAEDLDIGECLRTLDLSARLVRQNTLRYWRRLEGNPAEFRNSEAYFRVLVMITILQRDLGVHYNAERIDSGDFSDSRDLFLHGLISGHGGTCVSIPVLYVVMGQRLGYPIRLVKTARHLFARWDDKESGERFNIEATNQGLNTYPDDHYRTWPVPWNAVEIEFDVYLKTLTRRQELATFYAARGACLRDNDRMSEAAAAYRTAWQLDPGDPYYSRFAVSERCRAARVLTDRTIQHNAVTGA